MRIAIVGFEPEHEVRYPHLQATIDILKDQNDVEYIYFRERGGYEFVDRFLRGPVWTLPFKIIQAVRRLLCDTAKLMLRLRKANRVIAIDNLTYILSCSLHNEVILWSHDFITKDQARSQSLINKIMSSLVKYNLAKYRRLIIQDPERELLYSRTFDISGSLDVYHLPVSLPASKYQRITGVNLQTPVLVQIGGINIYRSASDQLVLAYQNQYSRYRLLLHGYFDVAILELLAKVNIPPICSALRLSANDVYKILLSADIGFIYYPAEDDNFRYIDYASGQLCEYLRLGIPVIYYGETSLKNFVEHNGIGISINSFDDIPKAIQSIQSEYHGYASRCQSLFQSIFNIDNYRVTLSDWVSR